MHIFESVACDGGVQIPRDLYLTLITSSLLVLQWIYFYTNILTPCDDCQRKQEIYINDTRRNHHHRQNTLDGDGTRRESKEILGKAISHPTKDSNQLVDRRLASLFYLEDVPLADRLESVGRCLRSGIISINQ